MATKNASPSTKKSTVKKPTAKVSTAAVSQPAAVTFESVVSTLKSSSLVGILVAEFIGAFLLTASFVEMQGNPVAVGFALVGIFLIVGGVSKAHLNPAMTIGAWVTKKIDWMSAIAYILAQLLGAGAAFLVLNTFLHVNDPTAAQVAAGATTSSLFHAATVASGKEWFLFFNELLGSSVLAVGVAAAVRSSRNRTVGALTMGFALLIALYLTMSIATPLLATSGVTLTFINPAIAWVSGALSWNVWPLAIYILAPVLGGVFGFVLYDFLMNRDGVTEGCDCK